MKRGTKAVLALQPELTKRICVLLAEGVSIKSAANLSGVSERVFHEWTRRGQAGDEVDAVADSEPIGSLLLAQDKVRNIADQATDSPYKDEYCCAVIVNGKYLSAKPKAAAAATRALLKGAKWVEANPAAAARLSVEKKYLASNPELNTVAISHLRYVPSVSGAEMKIAGMLTPSTDVPALAKRAFAHLDGVSDAWLQTLEVEKLADGQIPPDQDIRMFAEIIQSDTDGSCCAKAHAVAAKQ